MQRRCAAEISPPVGGVCTVATLSGVVLWASMRQQAFFSLSYGLVCAAVYLLQQLQQYNDHDRKRQFMLHPRSVCQVLHFVPDYENL
ncbi:hypothetical protein BDR07DRAFT_1410177 [Suillus spraguei]|nr:hypothetical protein BDR07DRAFT_1410177 [Suillus spraguei]